MAMLWDGSFHPRGLDSHHLEKAAIREGREVRGSQSRNWASRATQLPEGGWVQRWDIVILSIGGGGFSTGVAGKEWTGELGACAVVDDEGDAFGDWCNGGVHFPGFAGRLRDLRIDDRLQFVFRRDTGALSVANLSQGSAAECLCIVPADVNVYPVAAGTGSWAIRLENYVDEEPCVLTLHAAHDSDECLVDCAFTNFGGDELVAMRVVPEITVSDLWDQVSLELSQGALQLILPGGRLLTKKQDGALQLCEVMAMSGANGHAGSSDQDAV